MVGRTVSDGCTKSLGSSNGEQREEHQEGTTAVKPGEYDGGEP